MWKIEIEYVGEPTGPKKLETDARPVITVGEGMMRFQDEQAELWLRCVDVKRVRTVQSGQNPESSGW